jgi:thiol-disulfide isomerase/thioredoxin
MVYLEINKKNYNKGNNISLIEKLNSFLNDKKKQFFILFYMEGCGPCNQTRPEWSKLKNILSKNFLNREDIIIVSIDKDLFGKLKNIQRQPNSFPDIRFITNSGIYDESYEDSDIITKDRKIDSFIEWIKLKSGENNITKSEQYGITSTKNYLNKHHKKDNKTRKIYGGKWSAKYKKSINCKTPKGFSQKQYCKYGRKK